jgi:hypothetical protein
MAARGDSSKAAQQWATRCWAAHKQPTVRPAHTIVIPGSRGVHLMHQARCAPVRGPQHTCWALRAETQVEHTPPAAPSALTTAAMGSITSPGSGVTGASRRMAPARSMLHLNAPGYGSVTDQFASVAGCQARVGRGPSTHNRHRFQPLDVYESGQARIDKNHKGGSHTSTRV